MTKLTKKIFATVLSFSSTNTYIRKYFPLQAKYNTKKLQSQYFLKNSFCFFTYNKNSKQFVWNFYVNILLIELCFTKTQANYSENVSVVLMITENLRLFFISSLPAE